MCRCGPSAVIAQLMSNRQKTYEVDQSGREELKKQAPPSTFVLQIVKFVREKP